MYCSLPGSSVHELLQARILSGLPCPPPGDLSNSGIELESIMSHALAGRFLVSQIVKNLPSMQETQVQPLVWEDPPEKGMATHSSILAWKTP